jgi:hypothetical protein
MRGVSTWRSVRVRSYVLPLLLGALALRFLIPTGFMPGGNDGTTLRVSMCSAGGQNELIEIPAETAKPHCDFCTLPSLDAPLSPVNIAGRLAAPRAALPPQQESQIPEAPLARTQTSRAPPPRV